jgi:hypothetical protein
MHIEARRGKEHSPCVLAAFFLKLVMYAAFSLILRAQPAHQLTAASALAISYRTLVVDFMQACDNGSELDWERKDRGQI